MSLQVVLSLCLLACLVIAAPVSTPGRTRFTKQTTYHFKDNGTRITYNGVFIYKGGVARKLLDDGSALNVFYQPHAIAYLGGKDGLYIYDDSTEKLEKYGTLDERILGIAKSNNSDTLYIISEDHTVYKVTEGGTKKTKVDGADGATHIGLDWEDNLYFIGADKQAYVITTDGIKKKIDLPPNNDRFISLFKDFDALENGLNLLWNKAYYDIFADGTSRPHVFTDEEQAFFDEERRESIKLSELLREMGNSAENLDSSMSLRMVLSSCLLACLVTAAPVNTPGRTRITQVTTYNYEEKETRIIYDGVFIYKGGVARKLLDDGSALDVFYQPHAIAYIGGKDGLYIYDDSTEKLEKFGTLDERILDIAKSNNSDTLYIISEDHTVYKVTEGGTKKTKVDGADGATHIGLDWQDNLYFVGADKQAYVITAEGIKKIEGLPTNDDHFISLFKLFTKLENGLNLLWNKAYFDIFADGTSRPHVFTDEEQAFLNEERRESVNFSELLREMRHSAEKLGTA